jgi:hypothetical protein
VQRAGEVIQLSKSASTFFMVLMPGSIPAGDQYVLEGYRIEMISLAINNESFPRVFWDRTGGTTFRLRVTGDDRNSYTNNITSAADTPYLISALHENPNSIQIWVDGVLDLDVGASQPNDVNETLKFIRIGSRINKTGFWTGYIGEIIFFDTKLDPAERQEVETYLTLKYGL